MITVSAAAEWLADADNLSFSALRTWPNIELVVNKALEIAKATVAKRTDIGEDMSLETSTDTIPIASYMSEVKAEITEAADTGETAANDVDMEEEDYEAQKINAATEAVVAVLRSVRAVYVIVLHNLASHFATGAATDVWETSATSLVHHAALTSFQKKTSCRSKR